MGEADGTAPARTPGGGGIFVGARGGVESLTRWAHRRGGGGRGLGLGALPRGDACRGWLPGGARPGLLPCGLWLVAG